MEECFTMKSLSTRAYSFKAFEIVDVLYKMQLHTNKRFVSFIFEGHFAQKQFVIDMKFTRETYDFP